MLFDRKLKHTVNIACCCKKVVLLCLFLVFCESGYKIFTCSGQLGNVALHGVHHMLSRC